MMMKKQILRKNLLLLMVPLKLKPNKKLSDLFKNFQPIGKIIGYYQMTTTQKVMMNRTTTIVTTHPMEVPSVHQNDA